MIAVIPAAGRGSRLGNEPAGLPKALVDVAGRPLLAWVVEAIAPAVEEGVVVVSPREASIRRRLGDSCGRLPLRYVEQPEPVGVADAVARARPLVDGPFAVVMADSWFEDPLAPYVDRWRESGADGAVLLEAAEDRNEEPAGVVELGQRGVTAAVKGSRPAGDPWQVCGMMILPPEAFQVLTHSRSRQSGEYELEDAVQALVSRGLTFAPLFYQGWRRNVNTARTLAEVRQRAAAGTAPSDARAHRA